MIYININININITYYLYLSIYISFKNFICIFYTKIYGNDPSAGSPTKTLLRLLLPLNDQVWSSFQHNPTTKCSRISQSEDLTKSFNR